MLYVGQGAFRNCSGVTRREILQVGGLSALGLTLGGWWPGGPTFARSTPGTRNREVSCIFIFLSGGPSHFETFDPKPNAPVNIRGPYGTIATSVPGVHFSELLSRLAGLMDKCALIRSMTSSAGDHSGTAMLSGASQAQASYGAVLTKLLGTGRTEMPPFVHVGAAGYLPGAGTLGAPYNPVLIADPTGKQVELPQFKLTVDVNAERFRQRRELMAAVDQTRGRWRDNPAVEKMAMNYQRAVDLLTSEKVRAAFDLAREKEELRGRYGGTIFGQSCLMARRLVEAGTRFVQVNWYGQPAWHGWDVHGADLPGIVRMESPLCPRLDQGLSTLLDDLHQRGLLSSTLVVVTGEFGRTPQINAFGGRDHWPQCFSVLLAGAGIPGGRVVGASDNQGAYPADRPVTLTQLAATLYRLLGIDTNADVRIRPFIGEAAPVAELL